MVNHSMFSKRKLNIIILLLFLFSLNLFDQSETIFALCFFVSIIVTSNGVKISAKGSRSKTYIVLLLFSISYIGIALLYNTYSALYIIKRAVYPLFAYQLGYNMCFYGFKKDSEITTKTILSISLGFSIYGILNYITAGRTTLLGYRTSIDFWNGTELMPTFESTFFMFNISLLYYFIVCKNMPIKVMGFVGVVVSVIISFATASRTPIVVALSSAILFEILHIVNRDISASSRSRGVLRALVIIAILYTAFSLNVFGLQEKILGSELNYRMTNTNVHTLLDMSQRAIRYEYIFKNFWSHLMGNIDMGGLGSAHNTWLDIFRVSGIIPMLLFIAFTVNVFSNMVKLWKRHIFFNEDVLICILIVVCTNGLFLIESIIALNITYFWAYLIVCGMIEAKVHLCTKP